MSAKTDTPPPSTPGATAAVAQSRTEGAPERAPAGPAIPARAPSPCFHIGAGVLRAAQTHPYERRAGDPLYRPLRIFTLDPAASRLEGAVATVNVPYEPLQRGPSGALVEVDAVEQEEADSSGAEDLGDVYVDLEDPKVLMQDGRTPSPSDRMFHQQMVYAVTTTVYAAFQKALGRHVAWGFQRPGQPAGEPTKLLLRPHAFQGPNAYYDQERGELCFGYYQSTARVTGRNPPFGTVFACLSHDIVAHEVTHALLDGMRRRFTYPSGPDVLAFHEAFADLVAIFQHFSYEQVVRAAIRKSAGRVQDSKLLAGLAQQFGDTTGRSAALRSAIDDLDPAGMPMRVYDATAETHQLGSVLVAALFEAFTTVYKRKTARYVRLATNGTGELPPGEIPADLQSVLAEEASVLAGQFLSICIRAIDYCPPVDLTLGEFLRALITADHDLVPDDPWGYREALIDAFWRREIYPQGVESLSEDALLWRPAVRPIPVFDQLTFAALRFEGDPARPAGTEELQRQACALGDVVTRPEYMPEFGLAPPDHPDLGGDAVDLPYVESIRSTRRVGPDGQIVFDLVAEVTQRRTVRRTDGSVEFDCYGGATVILGPDGRVRYVISKSVLAPERCARQREFVRGSGRELWTQDPAAGPAAAPGRLVPQRQLFKLLHLAANERRPDLASS